MTISPGLSVVIPTRDRCATLALTLAALEDQRGIDSGFEAIVVDDGSVDHTSEWIAQREPGSFPVLVGRTSGLGPAAARNRGVGIASAPRILLLGDDTIPDPGTLSAHRDVAGEREISVQGFIEWDPEQQVTDLMRFLAPEGPQFWFKGLQDRSPVPFTSIYGSNMSAPTRWFLEEPFDESFPAACFEDTEMAWRWSRRGWQTIFSTAARCRHRHRYDSIEPILDRQRQAGAATRKLVRKHPRLWWRMLCQPLIAGIRVSGRSVLRGSTDSPESRWDRQCRLAWLRGLLRGV